MHKVGLIGHGAFGTLLTDQLSQVCDFTIYDPLTSPDNLQTALAQPIIVFALPIQTLEPFLLEQAALLRPDALYIDVGSVKIEPVRIMMKHLPASASIIATHPLFGPSSAKDGLRGQRIMLHRTRATNDVYQQFVTFLTDLGLQCIETTPEKHDEAMAYVQGLSHYIGRVLKNMDVPRSDLATRAYQDLLDMKDILGNDSDELFSAITHLNPYTAEILAAFTAAQHQVNQQFKI